MWAAAHDQRPAESCGVDTPRSSSDAQVSIFLSFKSHMLPPSCNHSPSSNLLSSSLLLQPHLLNNAAAYRAAFSSPTYFELTILGERIGIYTKEYKDICSLSYRLHPHEWSQTTVFSYLQDFF